MASENAKKRKKNPSKGKEREIKFARRTPPNRVDGRAETSPAMTSWREQAGHDVIDGTALRLHRHDNHCGSSRFLRKEPLAPGRA
jgi:hypothetical protein